LSTSTSDTRIGLGLCRPLRVEAGAPRMVGRWRSRSGPRRRGAGWGGGQRGPIPGATARSALPGTAAGTAIAAVTRGREAANTAPALASVRALASRSSTTSRSCKALKRRSTRRLACGQWTMIAAILRRRRPLHLAGHPHSGQLFGRFWLPCGMAADPTHRYAAKSLRDYRPETSRWSAASTSVKAPSSKRFVEHAV